MTPEEANEINLMEETNIEVLRELVEFWQNIAIEQSRELSKLKATFKSEDISTLVNAKKKEHE